MSRQFPLFTVITVVLNGRTEVEETMLSVLDQSERDFEYIVIDGGSNDGTLDVIRKYQNRLARVVSEPDQGIYDAFNKGIRLAKGEYIILLNSGDCFKPGALRRVADAYNGMTEKETVICGGLEIVDQAGVLLRTVVRTSEIIRKRYRMMFLNHPSTFVPRQVYEALGGYDARYRISGDFEFAHRLLRRRIKIHFMDDVITTMRDGGISSRASRTLLREYIRVVYDYGGPSRALFEGSRFALALLRRRIAVRLAGQPAVAPF